MCINRGGSFKSSSSQELKIKQIGMEGLWRAVFVMFVGASMVEKALADQRHVVGGSQGWEASTDFNSWVSAQNFKVGDQLVFKYDSGLHSVVELPDESAYNSCDIGNTIESKSSGNDAIKLTKPGTRYFACGTMGHCSQGMKVRIKVATGTASSTPSPASTSHASSLTSHYSVLGCFFLLVFLCIEFHVKL